MENSNSSRSVRCLVGVMLGLLVVLIGVMARMMMPQSSPVEIANYVAWQPSTVVLAEQIAVQDGGRVKPLSTYAGFTMLRLNGSRTMKVSSGGESVTLRPTEWLLDCVFRPEKAILLPSFRLDNSGVVRSLGLPSKKERDYYTYQELEGAREKLADLGKAYRAIEVKKRDVEQNQLIDLEENVKTFEALIGYLAFARNGLVVEPLQTGQAARQTRMSAVMKTNGQIRRLIENSTQRGEAIPRVLAGILEQVQDGANFSMNELYLFPPNGRNDRWQSAGQLMMKVMQQQSRNPAQHIHDIEQLEELAGSALRDDDAFRGELKELVKGQELRMKLLGEGGELSREIGYVRNDWFMRGFGCFVVGAVCLSVSLLRRKTRGVVGGFFGQGVGVVLASLFAWVGAGCCVYAIVQRCLIMNRPPVGNLYDTIIFIGATVVILCLVLRLLLKRSFPLVIATFGGAALILLARKYEFGDATDHMNPLVAVLNSNYWLTTHVITIALGYTAGLVTAAISLIFVVLRGFGVLRREDLMVRTLTRTAYGCLCLTLFLSLVGTVLGGIWANDSWGRFWGWDPKENGALMIVLWCLAILHARLGGKIREWGLHICNVFGAAVVGFSWWHVNFFNTGLHSYGFTAEKKMLIWVYYAVILVVGCFGITAALTERERLKFEKKAGNVGREMEERE